MLLESCHSGKEALLFHSVYFTFFFSWITQLHYILNFCSTFYILPLHCKDLCTNFRKSTLNGDNLFIKMQVLFVPFFVIHIYAYFSMSSYTQHGLICGHMYSASMVPASRCLYINNRRGTHMQKSGGGGIALELQYDFQRKHHHRPLFKKSLPPCTGMIWKQSINICWKMLTKPRIV